MWNVVFTVWKFCSNAKLVWVSLRPQFQIKDRLLFLIVTNERVFFQKYSSYMKINTINIFGISVKTNLYSMLKTLREGGKKNTKTRPPVGNRVFFNFTYF